MCCVVRVACVRARARVCVCGVTRDGILGVVDGHVVIQHIDMCGEAPALQRGACGAAKLE